MKIIQITLYFKVIMINKLLCALFTWSINTLTHVQLWWLGEFLDDFQFLSKYLVKIGSRLKSWHVWTIQSVPQLFQTWVVVQQEGATPYLFSNTRDFLLETFPKRRIGRSGPTAYCEVNSAPLTWHHADGLFLLGICTRYCLQDAYPWHKHTDDTNSRCHYDHHWINAGQY